jgi:hypothetical protein
MKLKIGLFATMSLMAAISFLTPPFVSGVQMKDFEIVATRPSDVAELKTSGSYPVLNSRSEIAGSFRPVGSREEKRYLVSLEGKADFTIEPLTYMVASKDNSRLISYGGHVDHCTISKVSVSIYATNGDLVKSVDTNIWSPFALSAQDNGDFWIAGKDGYSGEAFTIRKYSLDGHLLWEDPLPSRAPMRLVLSLDNRYAGLVLYDQDTDNREVRYYEGNGNLMYEQVMPRFFYGVEFISNDKAVVYSGGEWELYRLTELTSPIASGTLEGNPLGDHPITGLPEKNSFVIVTLGDETTLQGYRIQAIDAEGGQVIAENFFDGSPFWQPYRFSWITERGTVALLIDENRIVELEMR